MTKWDLPKHEKDRINEEFNRKSKFRKFCEVDRKGVSAARIGGMASYFYLMDKEELMFLQGGINGR